MDHKQWKLLEDDVSPPHGLELLESCLTTNQLVQNETIIMMDPYLGPVAYLEAHSPPPLPSIGAAPIGSIKGKKRVNRAPKPDRPNVRKRTSPEQALLLETAFKKNPKPDKEGREDLAFQTGLPSRNVQIWFQNRRAKARSVEEAMKKVPKQGDDLGPFSTRCQQNSIPVRDPSTPTKNSWSFPKGFVDPFTIPAQRNQQQTRSVCQGFPIPTHSISNASQFRQGSNSGNVLPPDFGVLPYPLEYYLTPDRAEFQVSPQMDTFDSDYNDGHMTATPKFSLISPGFSPFTGQQQTTLASSGSSTNVSQTVTGLAPSPCFKTFPRQTNNTPRLLQRRRPQYVMNDINTTSRRLSVRQADGNYMKSVSATELGFHPDNASQPWIGPAICQPACNELHRSCSASGLLSGHFSSKVNNEDDSHRTVSSGSWGSNDSIDTIDSEPGTIISEYEYDGNPNSIKNVEELKQECGELVEFSEDQEFIPLDPSLEDFLCKEM